jgi:uncharacterized protein (TIGR03790 family)
MCSFLGIRLNLFLQITITLLITLLVATFGVAAETRVSLPRTGLVPDDLAVIINDDDPQSQQIGSYYQNARGIPAANMIHLKFKPGHNSLTKDEFLQLKSIIDRVTPDHIQAYAVAWTNPYRVGCMSLTSALAFGYDENYCSKKCGPTAASSYFNSPSINPSTDHKLRPAMMLAGTNFEMVKSLIDRGVESDHSFPTGRAYLLLTSDKVRSVRSIYFEQTAKELADVFPIEILEAESIIDRQDVLFYFTGLAQVPNLQTLGFLPGALADHLTSTGGQLTDSKQMSSLRWLEAGATASYGTVVEPCNHPQKFPFPGIAMFHYSIGATAIEAYWKSVAWPGEGIFIGEPLARPFAPLLREISPGQFELKIFSRRSGRVHIEQSISAAGPFRPISKQLLLRRGANLLHFKFNEITDGYLRVRWN